MKTNNYNEILPSVFILGEKRGVLINYKRNCWSSNNNKLCNFLINFSKITNTKIVLLNILSKY